MQKVYRIIPAGPCWEAEETTSSKTVLRGPVKRDLIYRTIELAKKEQKCRVVIHNADGTIEEEKTYEKNTEKDLMNFLKLYQSHL